MNQTQQLFILLDEIGKTTARTDSPDRFGHFFLKEVHLGLRTRFEPDSVGFDNQHRLSSSADYKSLVENS